MIRLIEDNSNTNSSVSKINQRQYWEEVASALNGELVEYNIADVGRDIVIRSNDLGEIYIRHNWFKDGSPSKPVTTLNGEKLGRFAIWEDPKWYAEDIEGVITRHISEGAYEVKLTAKEKASIRKRSGIPPSSPELNQQNQLYSQDSYNNYGHAVTEDSQRPYQNIKEENDEWYTRYGKNLIRFLNLLNKSNTDEESLEASNNLRRALFIAVENIRDLWDY